jgi:uncharacterized ubiquitin-like protein YukD
MSKDDKKEDASPRWDIVNSLYDDMDKRIDELWESDKISYGEIEIAMMMMKEKMLQQKIEIMHHIINDKTDEEGSEAPATMYK